MAAYIMIAIIAYAIGSINFSVIFSKKMAGIDIRKKGSGNAGTTNMFRNLGTKAAAVTFLCDIAKGIVSIFIALLLGWLLKEADRALLVQIAAIAVILGHTFPIFFELKGGKGVATALGILLLINWQIGLICLVFALVLMILTREVSVGSLAAAILYPILTLFISTHYIVPGSYFLFSLLLALIIIFNHRENVKRIIHGTENKISFSKK